MLPYFYFLSPFILYGPVAILNRRRLRDSLTPNEAAREEHRDLALTLAGFSFTTATAILGFASLTQLALSTVAFSAMMSFLFYLASANIQGYKFLRWHDLLGDALRDSANLSLVLCLIHMIPLTTFGPTYYWLVTTLALGVWIVDVLVRLWIMDKYLRTPPEKPA